MAMIASMGWGEARQSLSFGILRKTIRIGKKEEIYHILIQQLKVF
jgi:hypothetical protein